jgi:hypothetical membrane protein
VHDVRRIASAQVAEGRSADLGDTDRVRLHPYVADAVGEVKATEPMPHSNAEHGIWRSGARAEEAAMTDINNVGTRDASQTRTTERAGTAALIAPALAGIVGPALFTAVFLMLEVLLGGRYDRVSEVASALEATPYGWVQQLNFVVFGVLTIAFAVGLHRGIRPTRTGIAGPALILLSGVGLLLAAAFPLREDAAGVTYDPGGHKIAGIIFFLTSALGLIALSRRLARDPRWRSLSTYVLVAGVLGMASFAAGGILVMPVDAPLHAYFGIVQRATILLVLFPCRTIIAARLLRVTRRPDTNVL